MSQVILALYEVSVYVKVQAPNFVFEIFFILTTPEVTLSGLLPRFPKNFPLRSQTTESSVPSSRTTLP